MGLTYTVKHIIGFIKKHVRLIQGIVVLGMFVILINKIRVTSIIEAFHDIRPRYFLFGFILLILNISLQYLKWFVLLRSIENPPGPGKVFVSLVGGFFFGSVSPGRFGEFARCVFLPNQPKLRVTALTVVDKAFNHFMIFFGGIGALIFAVETGWSRVVLIIIELLLVSFMVSAHVNRDLWERLIKRYVHKNVADRALNLFASLSAGKTMLLLGFTIVYYAVFTTQFYTILNGFTHISFSDALGIIPLIYIINYVLPISFGGFGIKDVSAVALFSAIGLKKGDVLSASILNNTISLIIPAIIGAFAALYMHVFSAAFTHEDTDVE